MRHTTTLLTAAVLALAGCSSSGEPQKETVTATTTPPPATPSLSHTETMRLCSVAVAEAAPDWDDWNIELDGWETDPRTPEVCKALADKEFPPRGNRAFQDALIDGLEAADDPRASQ